MNVTKSQFKRLSLTRGALIRERETKIAQYEEQKEMLNENETSALLDNINTLASRINKIDEKIGGRNGVD